MKQKVLYFFVVLVTLSGCYKNHSDSPGTIAWFGPQNLAPYNFVTIGGSHFDTSAKKNLVRFNGVEATVFKVQGDSILIVIVPPHVTAGKITITINGLTATSAASYAVLSGGWVRKADFPVPSAPNGRATGIGFAIGNTGYIGLGTDNGVSYNDLYAYDPTTDKWTAKSSLPIGLQEAFSMVINGKAYAGTGYRRDIGASSKQFFEYDPLLDKWTTKADFPGGERRSASAYAVGNKGYAGCRGNGAGLRDWWQYDPATDSWTRKADFPGVFVPDPASGFVMNNKIYIVGDASLEPVISELWQYDPANDTWTKRKNTPMGFDYLLGITINNKGYLMGGENWQYDDISDSWTQKAIFISRHFGSVFSIGNKGYYGTGLGLPSDFYNLDFWEYTPE